MTWYVFAFSLKHHSISYSDSPVCSKPVPEREINAHLDSNCSDDARSAVFSTTHKSKMSQASITSLFTPSSQKAAPTASSYYTPFSNSKLNRKRSTADDSPADTTTHSHTPLKRPRLAAAARLQSAAPLAERLRPRVLAEFVGQPHLTAPGSLLLSHLDHGATGSIVFWGPPGCVWRELRLGLGLAVRVSVLIMCFACGFVGAARRRSPGSWRSARMRCSRS